MKLRPITFRKIICLIVICIGLSFSTQYIADYLSRDAPSPDVVLKNALALPSVSKRLGDNPGIEYVRSGQFAYSSSGKRTGVYFYKVKMDGKDISLIVDWAMNPELTVSSVVESDSPFSSQRLYN